MKKISLCLVLAMLCAILLVGCDNSNPVSDFEYSVIEGKVSITGYSGKSDTVVIPEKIDNHPVTSIGCNAFMNSNIKSLTISDSIRVIRDYAFLNCENLKEVDFGNGIQDIDASAFENCVKLEKIILKDGVKNLGARAFKKCSSVKEIYIPKSLENCGMSTFVSNTSLTTLIFEDGIKKIDGYASFNGATSLKEITIPASVEKIGKEVFLKCTGLEKIEFLGNAPNDIDLNISDQSLKTLKIYHPKNATGWENTALSEKYTVIAD